MESTDTSDKTCAHYALPQYALPQLSTDTYDLITESVKYGNIDVSLMSKKYFDVDDVLVWLVQNEISIQSCNAYYIIANHISLEKQYLNHRHFLHWKPEYIPLSNVGDNRKIISGGGLSAYDDTESPSFLVTEVKGELAEIMYKKLAHLLGNINFISFREHHKEICACRAFHRSGALLSAF
jgi:hypothetical protein